MEIIYSKYTFDEIYNTRRKRHEKRNINHFVKGSLSSTCH